MVDRLVEKGFVHRVRSDADRRQVLVEMSEEGQARTWAAYGPLVVEGQTLLRAYGVAELDRMRDHLEELRRLTERHRRRVVEAS